MASAAGAAPPALLQITVTIVLSQINPHNRKQEWDRIENIMTNICTQEKRNCDNLIMTLNYQIIITLAILQLL